jgi:hypothetical protein
LLFSGTWSFEGGTVLSFIERSSMGMNRMNRPLGVTFGLLTTLLGAASAQAATFYVDANQGGDRTTCFTAPGPGTAACRSIMYVVNNVNLTGGDVVRVAAGRYPETLRLSSSDHGVSDASRLIIQGAGPDQTFIEGLSSTRIDDAACVPCTAANNCNGDGLAYANVYRCPGAPTGIRSVYETNWTQGRIIVDDRAVGASAIGSLGSRGQCDTGACTNVVFEPKYPYPYHDASSIAATNGTRGSWYQSGTNLFVHTFRGDAPSSAIDIEAAVRDDGLVIASSSANYITVRDLTIRYCSGQCITLTAATGITLENIRSHSGVGGIITATGTDNLVVRSFEFASGLERNSGWSGNTTLPTFGNGFGNGWIENGGGAVFNLKPNGADTLANALIEDGDIFDGWNVAGTEGVVNSTYRNVLIKNAPNHVWAPNGPPSGPVTSNLRMDRLIVLNGQEGSYWSGCQNCTLTHGAGYFAILDDGSTADSRGARIFSTISNEFGDTANGNSGGLEIGDANSAVGSTFNYNWYSRTDMRCLWVSTRYDCNSAAWRSACNCDANSIDPASTVTLAGGTWPSIGANGLTASRLTRSDFIPLAGSPLIDAGNPDIDLDGVLETACSPVRQDDCCDAANHCSGAAPDIGPYEFGIDGGAGGGSLVDPPANVRRIDRR